MAGTITKKVITGVEIYQDGDLIISEGTCKNEPKLKGYIRKGNNVKLITHDDRMMTIQNEGNFIIKTEQINVEINDKSYGDVKQVDEIKTEITGLKLFQNSELALEVGTFLSDSQPLHDFHQIGTGISFKDSNDIEHQVNIDIYGSYALLLHGITETKKPNDPFNGKSVDAMNALKKHNILASGEMSDESREELRKNGYLH